MNVFAVTALLSVGLNCSTCFALEAFKTYDNFGTAEINPDLWGDFERSSQIKAGALNLRLRNYGGTATDTGSVTYNLPVHFARPSTVTEIKAKVTVNAIEVNRCASSTNLSYSRARVNGSYFNIGTPTPGSEVNDAIAQMRLIRYSNSLDAVGVLRAEALFVHCTNADCSASTVVNLVDMGAVNVGQATTLQIQWDKPNKRFLYSRDAGAATTTITYADNDSQPPGGAFKTLDVRNDIANCASNPRLTGFIDATFDNVSVNKSAAP